jgi:uncharacterized membrane protein
MDEDDDTDLESVVASTVTGLTLLVAFGLMAAGVSGFWIAFPVGFGGVLPLAVGLARLSQRADDENEDTSSEDDPIATLRERYARGELTDAEFERRVEHLLETESIDDHAVISETAYEPEPQSESE